MGYIKNMTSVQAVTCEWQLSQCLCNNSPEHHFETRSRQHDVFNKRTFISKTRIVASRFEGLLPILHLILGVRIIS